MLHLQKLVCPTNQKFILLLFVLYNLDPVVISLQFTLRVFILCIALLVFNMYLFTWNLS